MTSKLTFSRRLREQPGLVRLSGFTLVEVMIVVAIIAILASVALPAYQDSVRKGKRAQGRTGLIEAMQAQEKLLTQTGSYITFSSGASGITTVRTKSGDNPANAAYDIAAEQCSPALSLRSCVRLIATPTFSDPDITSLRMESTGNKSCTGDKAAVPGFCWP